jgi:hypothetical protein
MYRNGQKCDTGRMSLNLCAVERLWFCYQFHGSCSLDQPFSCCSCPEWSSLKKLSWSDQEQNQNMWEVQKELVILDISWYSLISLHRTRGNDVSPAAHGLIWSYLALDYWQNVWRFGCTLLFIASIPSDSPIQVVRVFDSVESVESEAEPGSFLWRLGLGDANSAVGVWDAVRLQGLSNSGCEAHMRWMCLHVFISYLYVSFYIIR